MPSRDSVPFTMTRSYVLNSTTKSTRDGEYRINCPYCPDDGFHMYCNLSKNVYHCFKCDAKGKIAEIYVPNLEDYDRLSPYEKNLYKDYPSLKKIKTMNDITTEVRNLPLCVSFNNATHEQRKHAVHYLKSRGLSHDEIQENCKLSTEKHGPYKDTVIFPIWSTYKGIDTQALNYFVCRRYTNGPGPKYINAPWSKGDTLFIEKRTSQLYGCGVIVEGVFDALAVARTGSMGIALLGKTASSKQLLRLKKLCDSYVIYLDNDALAQGIQLKMQLETLGKQTVLLHHTKDASDVWQDSPSDLDKLVKGAISVIRNSIPVLSDTE